MWFSSRLFAITMGRTDTMAEELRKTLDGLLRMAGVWLDEDVLTEGIRLFSQALMELEVEEHPGAGRYERIAERAGGRPAGPGPAGDRRGIATATSNSVHLPNPRIEEAIGHSYFRPAPRSARRL